MEQYNIWSKILKKVHPKCVYFCWVCAKKLPAFNISFQTQKYYTSLEFRRYTLPPYVSPPLKLFWFDMYEAPFDVKIRTSINMLWSLWSDRSYFEAE